MDDFYAKVTQIGWLLYKSPPNIASFFTQQKKAPPDCPGPKRPAVKQKKWSTSLRAGMHDCIYTERKKEKQMLPYPSSLTYLNVTIWYLTHHVTLKLRYLQVTWNYLKADKVSIYRCSHLWPTCYLKSAANYLKSLENISCRCTKRPLQPI